MPARLPLRPRRVLRRPSLRAHRGAALPLRRGDPRRGLPAARPPATWRVLGLGVHTLFDGVAIAAGFIIEPTPRHAAVPRRRCCTSCPRGSRSRPSCWPPAARDAPPSGRAPSSARLTIVRRPAHQPARPEHHVGYALALSAGVTIYVAASDLIPEVNREGGPGLGLDRVRRACSSSPSPIGRSARWASHEASTDDRACARPARSQPEPARHPRAGVYGRLTLSARRPSASATHGRRRGVRVECRQSNVEGQLIDWLQGAEREGFVGVVLNPGAFTHYSFALRDAVAAHRRPGRRSAPVQHPRARGVASTLGDRRGGARVRSPASGPQSYLLGLEALDVAPSQDAQRARRAPRPGAHGAAARGARDDESPACRRGEPGAPRS